MTTTIAEQLSTVSLYERLGASAGIRRIVDGMVDAHLENPVIRARFQPYLNDPERVEEIKRHICAFFEMRAGGPGPYRGRCMVEAHRGMNIAEAEYVAAVDDILGTMRALGHREEERAEVLAMLYGLKDEIIRV
ncbi:group 1 truncated hemoglobin [Kaustia mangrovi]|uniref:Group 1 truncated hemoglobin n=1 Tax=Kaustia mangrovi TaxID=2593653 RepID=A0A7S8C5H5_9HYPH|nr:group 1 truncated hemoglobin [Kaustia mangrovi]QPC43748.1 group 1 truncated hemoglobin [Kaustia mangrovi]